jgi:DNA-binding NarL/FixJ family response regulator
MSKMINLLIADDEELFRKGMAQLLSDHPKINVIGEAANGQILLNKLRTAEILPDIILLDLKMPELDGVQATKLIKKEFPDIRIVVLTSHYTKIFIVNMVHIGASAFQRKDSSPASVIDCIIEVHKNGYYFDHEIMKVLQKSFVSGETIRKTQFNETPLSEREIEILRLICEQKKTSEIADELFISVRTVDGHRNNLLLKTESKNIAGLVLYAIEKGIYLI